MPNPTVGLNPARASNELNVALDNVRRHCGQISDELADMKRMAGINTAVTGVGTLVGAGATAVGFSKSALDNEIKALEKLPQLQVKDTQGLKQDLVTWTQNVRKTMGEISDVGTQKSKNLGNWRTGLLATNTVTNVAGTVIAGKNQIKGSLQDQISRCMTSVDVLTHELAQARVDNDVSPDDMARVQKIVTECGMWSTVNLNSVNKRAKGASVSSGIGAGVGLVGTITSVLANTDKTRSGNARHEQNMNTAANVMAGGATVASASATIFNATQISAIKRAADVADRCEEALK